MVVPSPIADARQDDRAAADPDAVADRDGRGKLRACGSLDGVDRMLGGVDVDAGAELDVAADRHRAAVEDDAAEVGVEVVAELDVSPVVATERRLDLEPRADPAEQLGEDLAARSTSSSVVALNWRTIRLARFLASTSSGSEAT